MKKEELAAIQKRYEKIKPGTLDVVWDEGWTAQEYIEALLQHIKDLELDRDLWRFTAEEGIEAKNIGAEIAAKKLRVIAESGKHEDVFGGEELEKAAQAILKLHSDIDYLGGYK